jgi:Putative Actinobacterial Holin-X, holin superfamily III
MANARSAAAPIADAVKQLSRDGAEWMSAEAELAQAELAVASKRALMAFGLAIGTGVMALASLIVVAFAAIALLAPYVGEAWATSIVALVFLVLTGILGWSAYRLAISTAEVTTFIKRWINAFKRLRKQA